MQKEKFKISADQIKGPLVKHVELANSEIESAMYELEHLKNHLGYLAKLPSELDVHEPIKLEEEHGSTEIH